MRRLDVKPKDRRKVPIPAKLRNGMREVYELIKEAKNNHEIKLNYDDAIQTDSILGGKYGTKKRPYVLIFYPEGIRERNAWHLTLHVTEIEDIGDGLMQEIVLYCCTSSDCQCKFREEDEHCFHCDYFDDPNYGTFTFPEAEAKLKQRGVTGIYENSSKENVITILGTPDNIGGDFEQAVLGYVFTWIVYLRKDCQLRFEFNKECDKITYVTVQEKDYEPGQ